MLQVVVLSFLLNGELPDAVSKFESNQRAILVDVHRQRLGAYEHGRLVKEFPISSGKPDTPTPIGSFAIEVKDKNHKSSKYTTEDGKKCKMTNGLKFAISEGAGVWFHHGHVPWNRTRASHGCVRLSLENSEWLFKWAQVGDIVVISRKTNAEANDTNSTLFSHSRASHANL